MGCQRGEMIIGLRWSFPQGLKLEERGKGWVIRYNIYCAYEGGVCPLQLTPNLLEIPLSSQLSFRRDSRLLFHQPFFVPATRRLPCRCLVRVRRSGSPIYFTNPGGPSGDFRRIACSRGSF